MGKQTEGLKIRSNAMRDVMIVRQSSPDDGVSTHWLYAGAAYLYPALADWLDKSETMEILDYIRAPVDADDLSVRLANQMEQADEGVDGNG